MLPEAFSTPPGTITLMGGAAVALLILAALALLLARRPDPMQKFSVAARTRVRNVPRRPTRPVAGGRLLDLVMRGLAPRDPQKLSAAREAMSRAGFPGRHAARNFAALQWLLTGFAGLGAGVVVFLVAPDMFDDPVLMAAGLISPVLIGYFAPRRWLENRIQTRKDDLRTAFPDALDMLLICVESGHSIDQAIRRVAQDMQRAAPLLAAEFATVAEQTKAGRARAEVLRDMAARCDCQDITSFVAVLVQASAFGTSIADGLRICAEEMRDKRMMRAEEKANLLPTKMTLGTMLFTLPPLLIILVGPSVVGVITNLQGGGQIMGF